jgi:hypothetical protein
MDRLVDRPGSGRLGRAVRLALAIALAPAGAGRAADAPADSLRFPPPSVRGWQSGAFRADRLQHASLAFTIGVGAGLASREPLAGAGVPLALGIAKELTDDHFDRGDLVADAVGAGLAALVVASLTRGVRR